MAALACDASVPENSLEPQKKAATLTKTDSLIVSREKNHDAGVVKNKKIENHKNTENTTTPSISNVYVIPKPRPSQQKSCKEKARFSEGVYQKALGVAQKKMCRENSDCVLVRNTTDCVMKSSCTIESYEGVDKTHAKRLIGLRAKLFKEVCPGCKKWAEKCRKPPMRARCVQRTCEVVSEHSALGLRLKIGAVQPAHAEIQKTFSRRRDRFERCSKRAVMTGGFAGGIFEYEWRLNDAGEVTDFKARQGQKYQKLNACLIKIIKPYRYPKPLKGQNQFRQTLEFIPER